MRSKEPSFNATLRVLEKFLLKKDWKHATEWASMVLEQKKVLRAVAQGPTGPEWNDMYLHPIFRVLRSAELDAPEWMKVYTDCAAHEDHVFLLGLLLPKASLQHQAILGTSREAVAVALKHPDKRVREIAICCLGSPAQPVTPIVPQSTTSSWREGARNFSRRLQRLPDPKKDIPPHPPLVRRKI